MAASSPGRGGTSLVFFLFVLFLGVMFGHFVLFLDDFWGGLDDSRAIFCEFG